MTCYDFYPRSSALRARKYSHDVRLVHNTLAPLPYTCLAPYTHLTHLAIRPRLLLSSFYFYALSPPPFFRVLFLNSYLILTLLLSYSSLFSPYPASRILLFTLISFTLYYILSPIIFYRPTARSRTRTLFHGVKTPCPLFKPPGNGRGAQTE